MFYGRTDVCSASTALTKKKDMLTMLAFVGPPCRAICLGPLPEVQLGPEGLARADALGLFVQLQGSRFIQRLSA